MPGRADKALIGRWREELLHIRRDLHAHPEIAFEERRTAERVADLLTAWGVEVECGLAGTGVVGVLRHGDGPALGLRADMDALAMCEQATHAHVSTVSGKMHACGHDGHMAMLLGAARYLSVRRFFHGTVYFIFQPAEENEAGGRVMVEQGLFERFPMQAVFGLHNRPGMPAGWLGARAGPVMAAADFFTLTLTGEGGHGAYPHQARDAIVAAAHIISGWQTLVSRRTDPLAAAVISVTEIHGGSSYNVIPETVSLAGTVRAFEASLQDELEAGMRQMASGMAAAHGVCAQLDYQRRYRATVNNANESARMLRAMRATVAADSVTEELPPTMGAEDFGWMLQRCPGAYGVIGNGTAGAHGASLHSPGYDFNDEVIPVGVAFWVNLVDEWLGDPAASG
jgi:amidohydrolase